MALLPKVKLKTVVSFPASVYGGTGIDVTKANGALTVDLDYSDFGTISSLPTSPTNNILTYDTQTNAFVMVPSHLLGGGVSGIADAPNDGTQYGRQSAAWTPISATRMPSDTLPFMDGVAAAGTSLLYSRGDHVHPTDTTRAPLASPNFIGAPAGPTPTPASDSSTKLATTAFVQNALASVGALPSASNAGYLLQTNGVGTAATWNGFLQSGTGAAARTWQDKARDVVSVKDFAGVDPTGSTDSTAGIQAAINAVSAAGGGKVYFPPGRYIVSALTISSVGVFLEGAGPQATTILPSGTTNSLFTFSITGSPSPPFMNQGISRMTIQYSTSTPPTGGNCIYVYIVQGFFARELVIVGAWMGIHCYMGAVGFFNDIQMWNLQSQGTGIYIDSSGPAGGGDRYFKNIFIDCTANPEPNQAIAGIRINGTGGDWFDSCEIAQCGALAGILIDPQSGQSVTWTWFTNCDLDTNTGHAVNISPVTGGQVLGVYFLGCWTSSSRNGNGVVIGGAGGVVSGARFMFHKCHNNAEFGFIVGTGAGTVSHVDISNSVVAGNSQASSGTYPGIQFQPGVGEWSVTNTVCGATDGFGVTQSYGIVVAPGASNNYRIIGNDVRSNITGGISEGGTGTVKYVSKNIGYNPKSYGVPVGASPFTYTNNSGDTQTITIAGGAVSLVTMNAQAIAVATNTSICVPQAMSIIITYSAAPAIDAFGA